VISGRIADDKHVKANDHLDVVEGGDGDEVVFEDVTPLTPQGGMVDLKVDLPFKTKAFENAWEEWVSYRKQIRKKLVKKTAESQLKALEKWGEFKAILSIQSSIQNQWIGLFFPEEKGHFNKKQRDSGTYELEENEMPQTYKP